MNKQHNIKIKTLADIPSHWALADKFLADLPRERLRSRFPDMPSGPQNPKDCSKLMHKTGADHILVATKGGVFVGLCDFHPTKTNNGVEIDIITAGGNLMPLFVAEVRRRCPGYLLWSGTTNISSPAMHRLMMRHLDMIVASSVCASRSFMPVMWVRDESKRQPHFLRPDMTAEELTICYLHAAADSSIELGIPELLAASVVLKAISMAVPKDVFRRALEADAKRMAEEMGWAA